MRLNAAEVAHLLLALALLLVAAHGFGYLFRRFRQPQVIGEILGGLLLGPTLLGHFFPAAEEQLFGQGLRTSTVLAAVYELGLLLLMFCSGVEIRAAFQRGERRTAVLITLTGTLIPFGLGLLFLRFIDPRDHMGPAASEPAFLLVFAIAIAVTSIPVISRILLDLNLLETAFARIVLSAAVIEDIILYVVLALALAMVPGQGEAATGLPALLGLHGASGLAIAYHAVATLAFFALALVLGPVLFRWAEGYRFNLLRKSSPVAFQLIFLMAMTAIATFLGIAAMFGAFVAGMVASTSSDDPKGPREAIKTFSFAFFIPAYFAIVGLKLDLVRHFDPLFFLLFLAFACAAKAASVYAGARMARESKEASLHLSVAMNARGGPGIVLASIAFDRRIIDEGFYAVLVMVAIVTSLLAGSWLGRAVRSGRALR